jgi:succinyl-CoA synthetase beta subunit
VILKEYEGRAIFSRYGIGIPKGFLVGGIGNEDDLAEAQSAMRGFLREYPRISGLVLKAQIMAGKRGKNGGVVFAGADDFAEKIKILRGREINGEKISEVLVAENLDIAREFYLGVTIDRFERCPVLIFSTEGGVDIEETAESGPEKISKMLLGEISILPEEEFIESLNRFKIESDLRVKLIAIAKKLVEVFVGEDCTLAEINPLILTKNEELFAADAKIIVDDSAIFRHADMAAKYGRGFSPQEKEAHELGLSYVELGGNLAIVCNGAGMVMSTMDAVNAFGARPANFCDIGGGADDETMKRAMKIVLKNKEAKALFINIFGGITRCDMVARGIVEYLNETKTELPVIVRMTGTNEAAGLEILEKAGINSFTSFEEAVSFAAATVAANTANTAATSINTNDATK